MQKGTAMTKYFSKDTPLASLERMMMSVPGFQKRGGGMMVLCRFHYKKEDVDCAYCQSYMRHTCQASVCPYIPERLEAGTVSYQELAEGCLHMAGHQKLWNRLSSLPKGKSLPLVLEPAHRRRLSEWLEAGIPLGCGWPAGDRSGAGGHCPAHLLPVPAGTQCPADHNRSDGGWDQNSHRENSMA